MPFWAIIIAYSLVALSQVSQVKKNIPSEFLLVLVIAIMIFPFSSQFTKSPQDLSLWIYGSQNPFVESLPIAQKLTQISSPNQKVFIAGSEPQILFYAKRQSASSFTITYPLIIKTPKRLKYQHQAIKDLQTNQPQVIVLTTNQFSGLWDESSPRDFIDFVYSLLEKEYKATSAYCFENSKGYFLENLKETNFSNCSLIIYEKNN
jgi:hypothetical protein